LLSQTMASGMVTGLPRNSNLDIPTILQAASNVSRVAYPGGMSMEALSFLRRNPFDNLIIRHNPHREVGPAVRSKAMTGSRTDARRGTAGVERTEVLRTTPGQRIKTTPLPHRRPGEMR
jgi:hypothetical protein